MDRIKSLGKSIHHRFKKKHLVHQALCHKSYIFDGQKVGQKTTSDSKFLADAILGRVKRILLTSEKPL